MLEGIQKKRGKWIDMIYFYDTDHSLATKWCKENNNDCSQTKICVKRLTDHISYFQQQSYIENKKTRSDLMLWQMRQFHNKNKTVQPVYII